MICCAAARLSRGKETYLRTAEETEPEAIGLAVAVHDRSSIEWVASIPLPTRGTRSYQVEFALEVPAQIYQSQDVWAGLRSHSRLQSPLESGESETADVRRQTLSAAHQLKTLRDGLARAQAAGSVEGEAGELVRCAVDAVAQMRRRLMLIRQLEHKDGATAHAESEEKLSDEFLSHQLLEFFATAQEVLGAEEAPWAEALRDTLGDAMAAEAEHRRRGGLLNPRHDEPAELSRFVERGAALNQHFADTLALETEVVGSEKRLRNWTTVAAGATAASIWFALKRSPVGLGASVGVGTSLAVVFVVYALKDRIKDFTKNWLKGRITRFYGHRTLLLRQGKRTLIEARESFDSESSARTHKGGMAGGPTVVLRYRMRAQAHASPELAQAGIERVKHVFQYDLSAFTARVGDTSRRVPVMNPETRRMTLADAPQELSLPVRLEARVEKATRAVEVKLVLSKRGLERIAGAPQADAFAAETLA